MYRNRLLLFFAIVLSIDIGCAIARVQPNASVAPVAPYKDEDKEHIQLTDLFLTLARERIIQILI
jgi:hypothetical protein